MTQRQINKANRLAKELIESDAVNCDPGALKKQCHEALKLLDNYQMTLGFMRLLRAFGAMSFKQSGDYDPCFARVASCIAYQHFLRKPSTKRKKIK